MCPWRLETWKNSLRKIILRGGFSHKAFCVSNLTHKPGSLVRAINFALTRLHPYQIASLVVIIQNCPFMAHLKEQKKYLGA